MNNSINSVLEEIRERLQESNSESLGEAKDPKKAEKHFKEAEKAYNTAAVLQKTGKGTKQQLSALSKKIAQHITSAKQYGYDPKKIPHELDMHARYQEGVEVESKLSKLVAKLQRRDDVKDPAALAAWIGRKKYGKERFAKMGESVDTEDLLVFEDVEDVLAFVEGLEVFAESEEQLSEPGLEEALDHAAMGAFRRANPTDAPKLYKRVKSAATAYLSFLKTNVHKEHDLQKEFIFAANSLKKSIEDSYGEASKAMPGTAEVWKLIRSQSLGTSDAMILKLQALLKSDETKIGSTRVRG